jgi:hypothetical protein
MLPDLNGVSSALRGRGGRGRGGRGGEGLYKGKRMSSVRRVRTVIRLRRVNIL